MKITKSRYGGHTTKRVLAESTSASDAYFWTYHPEEKDKIYVGATIRTKDQDDTTTNYFFILQNLEEMKEARDYLDRAIKEVEKNK